VSGGRWTANDRLLIVVLFYFSLLSGMYAQPSGYQGKRLMFKTDVISPITERGINVGFDYVVLRNLVIGADFSLTGKKYKQRLENYYAVHGNYPSSKAHIRDMQAGFTVRYFLNAALPAPKGSYIFSKYSIGQADIFGNHYDDGGDNPADYVLEAFKITRVPSSQIDVGLGYQEVVFGFLVLDFDVGLSAASLFTDNKNTNGTDYSNLISNFASKHGPNILSMGSWHDRPGGIGFSMHLKVGILLF